MQPFDIAHPPWEFSTVPDFFDSEQPAARVSGFRHRISLVRKLASSWPGRPA